MKTLSRKSLIGAFALVASLSAPLAFAQSAGASAQATPPTETTAQTETSVQGATAATQTDVAPANASARKSWSDVDADKNGALTKAEAVAVPALGKVFDQADGNADGSLTTVEYKAYVAQVQGGGKGKGGGK